MLISREELRFNFEGAQFDLHSPTDRRLLSWIFEQFLYGEVTGIQCGHWLYRAPSLQAATFLAKQAGEELSHVRRILRILSILGDKPKKAHWAIRFLTTGMMGSTWGEHVALEMALGEGLVLGVFYAMEDLIPHPEIQKILHSAVLEEEKHVEFGEKETLVWLESHPETRALLLGLALIQASVLQKLKKFLGKRLSREYGSNHPVISQFESYYDHSIRYFELRVQRLGLTADFSGAALFQLKFSQKIRLFMKLPLCLLKQKLRFKAPLLTMTYLEDPLLQSEISKFQPQNER